MKEYNYNQISEISSQGVLFTDGYFLSFEECRQNWAKRKGVSMNDTVCVAERSLDDSPNYLFYTDDKIKLNFTSKGFFARKRVEKRFAEFNFLLNRLGYSSYDMT